ncbi:MAG: alpha/beta hydrolase [Sphingomonadales bacterium]|nr:alpha/beta hydrolase [Sphingomonadales bacterium]
MNDYTDCHWQSRDGLKLHYRDYAGSADPSRPPVLCLPGLTRNVRDFAGLADHLSAAGWRVICPENRGRGDSAYARDSATYNPMQYVDDMGALFEQAGIERFVAVGTSLGGLMTMIMALTMPQRVVAAVLNDVGPVIEEKGLERIRDYVGQGRSFPTWMHAARALEETQGAAYPDYAVADWLAMAKRVMTMAGNGRIVFDYDMKIAEPFAQAENVAGVDLWPGLEALRGRPLLFLRGELSDLLSAATLAEMCARAPEAAAVTIARTGHAPTLDEPESRAAIEHLLAQVG